MGRMRYIKPDYFTDKDLASCGESAMLLFAGLWTIADREGRLKDIPFWIHGQVFPYFKDKNVDELLKILANKSMIVRYSVNGNDYIQITNFSKHQHIHPKETQSVIPENPKPEKKRQSNVISRKRNGRAVDFQPDSIPSDSIPSDSIPSDSIPSEILSTSVDCVPQNIINDLNLVCNRNFKLNKTTEEHIKRRLAEGWGLEDFEYVHRIKQAEWGDDPKMCQYLRPQTLYRPDNFQSYRNQDMGSVKLSRLSHADQKTAKLFQELHGVKSDVTNS